MSKLRRYHSPGNWYFITNVTYNRAPILIEHIDLLWLAIKRTQRKREFGLRAWVVLPDHFHFIIDSKTSDISDILQRVKMSFALHWRARNGVRTARVWQNRFWDHIIRDDADLGKHLNCIHHNPVRHGYVSSPFDWEHSSIHKFHGNGIPHVDFAAATNQITDGEFGE